MFQYKSYHQCDLPATILPSFPIQPPWQAQHNLVNFVCYNKIAKGIIKKNTLVKEKNYENHYILLRGH